MKFFIYFDNEEHSFNLIDENTSPEAKEFLTKGCILIDTFDSTYEYVQDIYQNKTSNYYKAYLAENNLK